MVKSDFQWLKEAWWPIYHFPTLKIYFNWNKKREMYSMIKIIIK